AEFHGARLAAVLAADPDLQIAARASAQLDRHLDELADTPLIEALERIFRQEAVLDVKRQESAGVVPREPECGLRQIVRAEREEFRFPGDVISRECGARQLDHGAEEVWDCTALALEHLLCDSADDLLLINE